VNIFEEWAFAFATNVPEVEVDAIDLGEEMGKWLSAALRASRSRSASTRRTPNGHLGAIVPLGSWDRIGPARVREAALKVVEHCLRNGDGEWSWWHDATSYRGETGLIQRMLRLRRARYTMVIRR
jgi:hypothetical protein